MAHLNTEELYQYPVDHNIQCTQGCMPQTAKAGQIFRFTYNKLIELSNGDTIPSSDDKDLVRDHYVLMLPEGYRTGPFKNNLEYSPCLVVRIFRGFFYAKSTLIKYNSSR